MTDGCRACGIVPVTMGSPAFRSLDAGPLRVTSASFPAGQALPSHAHQRTIVGVMLEGGFDVAFRSARFDCPAGTVWVEPGEERHANTLGPAAARPLVIEIDAATQRDELRPCRELLDRPVAFCRPETLKLARELKAEVDVADSGSLLAIESLAAELLASAASQTARDSDAGGRGGWVAMVRDQLHEHLDRHLRVADLAREAGVHRVHLGRVFRARYGMSVGDYHRRLRIEWAARQLAGSDTSISDIALRAGFADQAHFTRLFQRHLGMTPGAFRARGRFRVPSVQ